ncbi:hypothetical protein CCR75_003650 [Bremia lactucae]|uniref:RxLR effector protein n=1 Tax=Bremia lactucae TaxID=4779 RepID=A0A976ILK8_BRELC|nr:hypothetical protein CCR75_003650 [Bremia lactucae]
MFSTVLFLVAACAKSSYGHSMSIFTRDSTKYIASNFDEYSTIPEDIDAKRRLREAVGVDGIARDAEKTFADIRHSLDRLNKDFVRSNSFKNINPLITAEALVKQPSFYQEAFLPLITARGIKCSKDFEFATMALLGVSPGTLRQKIQVAAQQPSNIWSYQTSEYNEHFVASYKKYLDVVFMAPTISESSAFVKKHISMSIPEPSEMTYKLLNAAVIQLLQLAIRNVDDVNELAKLATSVTFKYALEHDEEFSTIMMFGNLEAWISNPVLNKLLMVHQVLLKS